METTATNQQETEIFIGQTVMKELNKFNNGPCRGNSIRFTENLFYKLLRMHHAMNFFFDETGPAYDTGDELLEMFAQGIGLSSRYVLVDGCGEDGVKPGDKIELPAFTVCNNLFTIRRLVSTLNEVQGYVDHIETIATE